MTFDPKALAKSPAFATAGGVVLGAGLFTFINGAVEHMVRPFFNFIFESGVVILNRSNGVYWGCGGFLSVCIVLVLSVLVGVAMIKMAGKP